MSRKHYVSTAVIIAAQLSEARGTPCEQAVTDALRETANDLAAMFEAENSRFDRDRFMAACGFPA